MLLDYMIFTVAKVRNISDNNKIFAEKGIKKQERSISESLLFSFSFSLRFN